MKPRLPSSLLACAIAFGALPALAAEPPVHESLGCTVQRLSVGDGLRLELALANTGEAPLTLAPGPHLVLYHDASATDAMGTTARLDRVQMTTLTLLPRSSQPALYSMSAVALEALRCNGRPPAAAALYFYQHNQRPQFRCLLRGYDLQAMGMHLDCPQVNPLAPSGPPK